MQIDVRTVFSKCQVPEVPYAAAHLCASVIHQATWAIFKHSKLTVLKLQIVSSSLSSAFTFSYPLIFLLCGS